MKPTIGAQGIFPVGGAENVGLPSEVRRTYAPPQRSAGITPGLPYIERTNRLIEPGGEFEGFSIIPPVRYETRGFGVTEEPIQIASRNWKRHSLTIQNLGPGVIWIGSDVSPIVPGQNSIFLSPGFERTIDRPSSEIIIVSDANNAQVCTLEGVYEPGAYM
jgi:hypothetical protein